MPPPHAPVKLSHRKMAPKDGHINFMFLGLPYPASGSATGGPHDHEEIVSYLYKLLLSANDTATHQNNHTLSSLPRLPQKAVLNNHSVCGG